MCSSGLYRTWLKRGTESMLQVLFWLAVVTLPRRLCHVGGLLQWTAADKAQLSWILEVTRYYVFTGLCNFCLIAALHLTLASHLPVQSAAVRGKAHFSQTSKTCAHLRLWQTGAAFYQTTLYRIQPAYIKQGDKIRQFACIIFPY